MESQSYFEKTKLIMNISFSDYNSIEKLLNEYFESEPERQDQLNSISIINQKLLSSTTKVNTIPLDFSENDDNLRYKIFQFFFGRMVLGNSIHKFKPFEKSLIYECWHATTKSKISLLLLLNLSRAFIDSNLAISNFLKYLQDILPNLPIYSEIKKESLKVSELSIVQKAECIYKNLIDEPVVQKALTRIFKDEIKLDNDYEFCFSDDPEQSLQEISKCYKSIDIKIVNDICIFNGMCGPNLTIYVNLDKLWRDSQTEEEKLAALVRLIFHEGTHSVIRALSKLKYGGSTHRGDGSAEGTDCEAGFRFELYLFGVFKKKYWLQKEFAERILRFENYSQGWGKFFTEEEINLMKDRKCNFYFSGVCTDSLEIMNECFE